MNESVRGNSLMTRDHSEEMRLVESYDVQDLGQVWPQETTQWVEKLVALQSIIKDEEWTLPAQ